MNALSRVLLRYGDLLFGTLATLLTAGYLLALVLMLALGRPLDPDWPAAVAYLPVGLITWLICAPAIRLDVALGGETPRTATIRRLVRYTVAGLALAAFWLGLTEFVRLILLAVLRVRPADPAIAAGLVDAVCLRRSDGLRGRSRLVGTLVVATGAGTSQPGRRVTRNGLPASANSTCTL